MNPLLVTIFCIFSAQPITTIREALFSDRYFVTKRIKRRADNITTNNTAITTHDQPKTINCDDEQQMFNQNDVISSEFEAPEFACTRSDSKAANIYCRGDILHVVMMLSLYNDSKTFVDKPLKKNPNEVIDDFHKRFPKKITEDDREKMEQFIKDNYEAEGEELNK